MGIRNQLLAMIWMQMGHPSSCYILTRLGAAHILKVLLLALVLITSCMKDNCARNGTVCLCSTSVYVFDLPGSCILPPTPLICDDIPCEGT
mmetsp:Transcript_21670/g.52354  ORF Transcript_21670/g.52354 Transcript_21670/m.52354 type:complete len:91 (+) Transcript_21670:1541-1813(+)